MDSTALFTAQVFTNFSPLLSTLCRAPVQHTCPSIPVQGFLCHLPSLSPAPLCQDLVLGCSWHPGHRAPGFCQPLVCSGASSTALLIHPAKHLPVTSPLACNLILFLKFVLYLPVLEASYHGWLCPYTSHPLQQFSLLQVEQTACKLIASLRNSLPCTKINVFLTLQQKSSALLLFCPP